MEDEKIKQIMEIFDYYDEGYPWQEVEEAIRLKDEIAPHLIEHLKMLLADPSQYVSEDHYGNMYAFILLAHFRETKAHQIILEIGSLPEEDIDDLFGDMITEGFPWIFYATCGGSIEHLKKLVLNKEAYEFCRNAAAQAIVQAVIEEDVPYDEVFEFFSSLFSGDEAHKGSIFWDLIGTTASDIYPEKMSDVLKKGFDKGLIDSRIMDDNWAEEALSKGKEQMMEEVAAPIRKRLNTEDIHSLIKPWVTNDASGISDGIANLNKTVKPLKADAVNKPGSVKKKGNKANKKNKKAAKKSRKKNR